MELALLISNAALWALVVVLALVVLALARQVGVLHERMAPAGVRASRGPSVGDRAPPLKLETLDGVSIDIGKPNPDAIETLLFFLSPTCPVCKTLLPTLKSARDNLDDRLQIILAGEGSEREQRRFVTQDGLADFCYVAADELGSTFGVSQLPYTVLLDASGVVRHSGLVDSPEALNRVLSKNT